jgi:RHS repeat-associated protein
VQSQSNAGVEFRYGYTGREQDRETGLDYYRARYYDASNGRFISEDPLGFGAGDGNLTRYVGNNPTNFTDPSGKCLFVVIPVIGLTIGELLTVGAVTVGGVGTINQVNGYFKDAGGELEPNIFTFPLPHNPLDRGDHRPETYGGTPGAIPHGIPPTDLTPYNYPQLFPGNVAPPLDHHVPVFNTNTGNPNKNGENLNPEEGAGENPNPNRLTGGGRKAFGNLGGEFKDITVAEGIKARGGTGGNVQQVDSEYRNKTGIEIANLAAAGDPKAVTALKILKQANSKGQKYSGK